MHAQLETAMASESIFYAQVSGRTRANGALVEFSEPHGAVFTALPLDEYPNLTFSLRCDSMQCPPFWLGVCLYGSRVVEPYGIHHVTKVTAKGGRLSEAGRVVVSVTPLDTLLFTDSMHSDCNASVTIPREVSDALAAFELA